jgi:hypothetical protein
MCPTADMSERHVPDVLHVRDFSPVVRKQIEDVAPPSAHPVVPAIVALQRPEARLDLKLIVHQREYRIEITAVENLIHQQGPIHVLARHPRAQYRVSHRLALSMRCDRRPGSDIGSRIHGEAALLIC